MATLQIHTINNNKANNSIIIDNNYSNITFRYNGNSISCELESDTTL